MWCTFTLPDFDGKKFPPIGVDEEFPQDTQWVDKEGVVELFPWINTPLDWTWNPTTINNNNNNN